MGLGVQQTKDVNPSCLFPRRFQVSSRASKQRRCRTRSSDVGDDLGREGWRRMEMALHGTP
jgi:hypothetical protein